MFPYLYKYYAGKILSHRILEKAYSDIGYPHPTKAWDLEYQEKVRRFPIVEHRIITKAIKVQVGP